MQRKGGFRRRQAGASTHAFGNSRCVSCDKKPYTALFYLRAVYGVRCRLAVWQEWLKTRSGPSQNGGRAACSRRSPAQYQADGSFFLPGVPPVSGTRPLQAGGRLLFFVKRPAFRRGRAFEAAETSKRTYGNRRCACRSVERSQNFRAEGGDVSINVPRRHGCPGGRGM